MDRAEILDAAKRCVCGERELDYGTPENCHPYSSYERGSNENLNKMFRRLFPKGTDFDYVDDEEIIKAADWMNNYPREILGRTTAARAFNEQLAQIMA